MFLWFGIPRIENKRNSIRYYRTSIEQETMDNRSLRNELVQTRESYYGQLQQTLHYKPKHCSQNGNATATTVVPGLQSTSSFNAQSTPKHNPVLNASMIMQKSTSLVASGGLLQPLHIQLDAHQIINSQPATPY